MHPDHNCFHRGICLIPRNHAFKPFHLCRVKLIVRSIVQVDKVDPVAHPVIEGGNVIISRIIFQSLRFYFRSIQPLGKLLDELRSRFRRNNFMVADSEKKGIVPKEAIWF